MKDALRAGDGELWREKRPQPQPRVHQGDDKIESAFPRRKRAFSPALNA